MNYTITNALAKRVSNRIKPIKALLIELGITKFRVGGNSLNPNKPNDIDLYPIDSFHLPEKMPKTIELLSRTKNATTIRYNNTIVQFCNYQHPSLDELVRSFDFSHIQIGAEVELTQADIISEIYYTHAYIEARVLKDSTYTGSDYPLSSLFRLNKYSNRKEISRKQFFANSFRILTNVIERGFKDYEDFKDQLDAVDLGLVPEDFQEVDGSLMRLFELLERK